MTENILLIWTTLADPILFFILGTFAAFRLAEMVAIDEGPFKIFFELRSWANDSPMNNGFKRNLSDAITCVHCAGLYFAFGIVLGYLIHPKIASLIIFPLAIAGLQSMMANRLGRQG
jgi:hypothetical protein